MELTAIDVMEAMNRTLRDQGLAALVLSADDEINVAAVDNFAQAAELLAAMGGRPVRTGRYTRSDGIEVAYIGYANPTWLDVWRVYRRKRRDPNFAVRGFLDHLENPPPV